MYEHLFDVNMEDIHILKNQIQAIKDYLDIEIIKIESKTEYKVISKKNN